MVRRIGIVRVTGHVNHTKDKTMLGRTVQLLFWANYFPANGNKAVIYTFTIFFVTKLFIAIYGLLISFPRSTTKHVLNGVLGKYVANSRPCLPSNGRIIDNNTWMAHIRYLQYSDVFICNFSGRSLFIFNVINGSIYYCFPTSISCSLQR